MINVTVVNTVKMTYADVLEIAINDEIENGVHGKEYLEKLMALRNSIVKKNSAERKPTATQVANASLKEAILYGMETGKSYTITDLMKSIDALSDLSNQRVSALVRQLVESGDVYREEIKRKAYFSLTDTTVALSLD